MANIGRYKPLTNYWATAVIPAYNEEKCLKNCILSLRNQNFPIEVIVVDDGSNDQTFAICEALRVKTLRQSHKGPGAARNTGARNSKGNILVFVDADMEFAPNYVSKLVEPIIKSEAIATCHWNERVANWNNPWARCQAWFQGLPDKRREPLAIPQKVHIYRAVRKDFFLDSGGFSEEEGRGDDSSVARRTGVFAKVVTDAVCYHKNLETLYEVFRDAIWRGRNVSVSNTKITRRILSVMLIHNNPIKEVVRGLILAHRKKEARLIPYSIIFTIGFMSGICSGMFSKYYLK